MAATTERFTALDVFRGMTICFMIIVNAPVRGQTYGRRLIMHPGLVLHPPISFFHPSFLQLAMRLVSLKRNLKLMPLL
ncbi:hypothetical protein [Mucilaginibacter metallidurans]|uniref:hypothetical protein n=1 Tax=Mucilaginibacter sp. P4 TaxID=3383180 RepID=UPI001AD7873F|nr:hypothetical protein [Mucilaginibacter gossypii]